MWFKNLRVYRLPASFEIDAETLHEKLMAHVFTPCGKSQEDSFGWIPPILDEGSEFVHVANGCIMVCGKRQDKLLPASVVREELEERAVQIAEREGRRIGRKERAQMRDEIRLDLLPKAFVRSKVHYAYFAPKQGWLLLDAASDKQAEEFLESLRDALGSLPVVPLTTKSQPVNMMTQWVKQSSAPGTLDLGEDCELRDPLSESSVIRCKHQDLQSDDIINHVNAGMEVSRLALIWNGGIECLVDDKFNIKRLRFADEIHEQADEVEADGAAQKFDIEFSVMTIEIEAFLKQLIEAFGGVDTSLDKHEKPASSSPVVASPNELETAAI